MSTLVLPTDAPRWVRKDRRVRHEVNNCWWCGWFAGHIVANAHPVVACLACGTEQCSGSSGKCAACFIGWLPGWSRGHVYEDGRNVATECGYKGCTTSAVADAPRVQRVCAEHLRKAKDRGVTLAERIDGNVAVATGDAGTYNDRWRRMVWATSRG